VGECLIFAFMKGLVLCAGLGTANGAGLWPAVEQLRNLGGSAALGLGRAIDRRLAGMSQPGCRRTEGKLSALLGFAHGAVRTWRKLFASRRASTVSRMWINFRLRRQT
ncbi:hypothetical protein, partial [Ideonella sp.]|uniref:hypothetical protein n=1 Tax=Ideonella sp. TaxID=1929293 RepID=UPI003BB6C442